MMSKCMRNKPPQPHYLGCYELMCQVLPTGGESCMVPRLVHSLMVFRENKSFTISNVLMFLWHQFVSFNYSTRINFENIHFASVRTIQYVKDFHLIYA